MYHFYGLPSSSFNIETTASHDILSGHLRRSLFHLHNFVGSVINGNSVVPNGGYMWDPPLLRL